MPRGNKKGKVWPVFSNFLKGLQEQADSQASAVAGSGFGTWNIPSDLGASHLFDIGSLHDPSFDRDDINANYQQCFQDGSNPGTTGDVIGLKLQIEYLAAAERAFRLRHASTARLICLSGGRRYWHGNGPVFPHIEESVGKAITAGAAE